MRSDERMPMLDAERIPMLDAVMPLEGRLSRDCIIGGMLTCDTLCWPFIGIFEGCLSLSDLAASSAASMDSRLCPPKACLRSYLRLK